MKYKAIKHANVNEALTNAEFCLRNLVGKANRSLRAGKPLALTATNVSILAGHSLSSVRAAKHMLGMPTIEPRTPGRTQRVTSGRKPVL
jgi:hypothetical protein